MILSIFKTTIDPLLQPEFLKQKGNSDSAEDVNEFNLIYSDYQKLNTRSSYNKENLYPIPELNQFVSRKEKEKIISSRIYQQNQ